MRKTSTEYRVGLFVLVVLAALSFMTVRVGRFTIFKKEGYRVHVYFDNIAGLSTKSRVRIAGVDAGVIEKITLEGNHARVTVRMDPEIVLYSDAVALINATGLLGDKYLAIKPGKTKPVLREGDVIRNVRERVGIDEIAVRLTRISESIMRLTDNLNEIVGTEVSKQALRDSIRNLKKITEQLSAAISRNDRKLATALDNINRLATSLQQVIDENSVPLRDTLANIRDFSGSLRDDGPELVANIREASASLKEIAGRIERGEGTIGKLVQDEKLYDSVSGAAEGLGRTLSRIERFRTFLTFQGEYLTGVSSGKGYFYVTLQPRNDQYYILGVVGDSTGNVTKKTTITTVNGSTTVVEEEERKDRDIEFTAQFGKRFGDTVLRLGLVENTFGFGIDQFFMHDRLKLTADLWDFSGEQEGADNPHVKVGADYFFYRRLYLSAGYDNIFNSDRAGVYFGGGVRFEDEDFKYLMSNIKLSPR